MKFSKYLLISLFLLIIGLVFHHQINNSYETELSPVHSAWDNHGWWLANCPLPKELGNRQFNSQFYEDYILSLIFSDVKIGKYIDVGAYHPDKDSVTKYFYLRNWNGINIDPLKGSKVLFDQARTRDINLEMGVSNEAKTLIFHQFQQSGLSSFSSENIESYEQKGIKFISYEMPVLPLNTILKQYPLRTIDFIKIDVEGFEREVLEGIDLTKHRPKIFIIEATVPCTLIPSHKRFEDILTSNHYHFVLFDGINRYYLAKEHGHLLDKMLLASKCACFANRITDPVEIFKFNFYFNKAILEDIDAGIKGQILNYYFAGNLL